MKRFVEGLDRGQSMFFPERLDDFVADDNPVRVIEAFAESSIWANWVSVVLIRKQRAGRPIIRRFF